MLGWLINLIVGNFCFHKWKIINKVFVDSRDNTGACYDRYYLQCEKCGDVKHRNMI